MVKNVLIIGQGGREYALGWKLKQSPYVSDLFFAPGNGGTAVLGHNINIESTDIDGLIHFVKDHNVHLTIVGPEQPLVEGIVDAFRIQQLKIVGPDSFASQLEGSKVFAKNFMKQNLIPTAAFNIYDENHLDELKKYLETCQFPVVLKADGLAAGKGVIIPENREEAMGALSVYFDEKAFGKAGTTIVVEDFLQGEEASVFVLTDGTHYTVLPAAQDHKRIGDGDTGKNTGGMGSYAPAPVVTEKVLDGVKTAIIEPTLNGLRNLGHPYNGILYIGIMVDGEKASVVEYNVRFGDPECQILMKLIENDLFPVMESIADDQLSGELSYLNEYATTVVIAAEGYPDQYQKEIPILFKNENWMDIIFHAGTAKSDFGFVSTGGRVLNAMGTGKTLKESIQNAYQAIEMVEMEQAYFRKDIGQKGLKRLESKQ